MIAVLMLTVELLRFSVESNRASLVVSALERDPVGVSLSVTRSYVGDSDVLMVWGPGGPDRVEPMRRQLEAGGHVVALDLSYWQRDTKFRVSIDAPHPQRWVMHRDWPDSRLAADRVRIDRAWKPDGPVVVAGIGEKATVQYGSCVRAWELDMIATARARGRRVLYRPKKTGAAPEGVPVRAGGAIDDVLKGASLLVTWHSNVAVDAIRMGIPVICRDGAAAAVCQSTWQDDPRPLDEGVRARFLSNLAWFQWSTAELPACWAFLREVLA